ncbi:MAG: type II toxin-antitoxin system HicB family antitoxin [Gammaproteobacteria bacterium]
MEFCYPAKLTADKGGNLTVTFRDIPEALTEGRNEREALAEAIECLVAALGGYVNERREIPQPSRPCRGERLICLPPLAAAKIALYRSMTESGLTRVGLGKKLNLSEGAIRRLVDLDHRSHIGQIEAALAVLGKRLVVNIQDAA